MQLRDDGTVRVATATQDISTSTYTILAQLAAQKTGISIDKIEVALSDTSLPPKPLSSGSLTTGSLVPGVFAATDKAIKSLLVIAALTPSSPFANHSPDQLIFKNDRVFIKSDGSTKNM